MAPNLARPPRAPPGPILLSGLGGPPLPTCPVWSRSGSCSAFTGWGGGSEHLRVPCPLSLSNNLGPYILTQRSEVPRQAPRKREKELLGEELGPCIALPSACDTGTLRRGGGGSLRSFKDKSSSPRTVCPQIPGLAGGCVQQVCDCAGNPGGPGLSDSPWLPARGRAQGGLRAADPCAVRGLRNRAGASGDGDDTTGPGHFPNP